jgi:membrane protease YdiL (CAAX protease family)
VPTDAPSSPRLHPLRTLVLYLAGVFAGGALVAPWLYWGVQAAAEAIPALAGVAANPFSRFVNRALMLAAVAGLPWFVRGMGMRSWADVGLDPRHPRWRRFAAGFALGLLSLAAVCAIAVLGGARTLDTSRTPGEMAGRVAGVLATALVVGVLEELLFRGAIFGGLRRAVPWPTALLASSAVYAIVHFLARPDTPPGGVAWDTGFRVLPSMLRGMTDLHTLLPAFLSLTLAGVVLGLAYQRTGDLFASIGIHAGWIFWLKYYDALTNSVPGASPGLWGTNKLVDGWFACAAIVVVLAVVLAAGRGHPRRADG